MKHLRSVLDILTFLSGATVLAIIVTGGVRVPIGHGGHASVVDLTSTDAWGLAFLILLGVRIWISNGTSVPVQTRLRNLIERITASSRPGLIALAMVVVPFLALFLAHSFKHLSFFTDAHDLVFVHQPLFTTWLSGTPLACSLCLDHHFFTAHISPSLLILTPIGALAAKLPIRDHVLFLVQSLLLAAPLWLMVRFGPLRDRRHLWWVAIAIFLAFRSFRNAAIWDLREDDLAFAFYLLALTALYCRKTAVYICALLLATLCKENMGIVTAFMAVPILTDVRLPYSRSTRSVLAAATFVLGVAWTLASFWLLIPHFRPGSEGAVDVALRFAAFGKTPHEVLVTILFHPSSWPRLARLVLSWPKIKYLLFMLLPVALPVLRSGSVWLIPAMPGVLMNVLSTTETQVSMNFHYDLIVLPFLFLGILRGIRDLDELPRDRKQTRLAWCLMIALSLSGRWPMASVRQYWPDRKDAMRSLALGHRVPRPGEIVAADTRILAQISHFPETRELSDFNSHPEINTLILDLKRPDERALADEAGPLVTESEDLAELRILRLSPRRGFSLGSRQDNPSP